MKRIETGFIALAILAVALPANAALMFTEDFSDNSPGPNMALGTGLGSPSTNFTGDFTIGSGLQKRIYLGTDDTDYSLTSFVFEVEMTSPGSTSPWAGGFIGMGTADAVADQYGEPVTQPHVIMLARPDYPSLDSRDNAPGAIGNTEVNLSSIVNSTHLLRLTWNHITGDAFFEFDQNNNGSTDGSFHLDGSDNGFNVSNSQLFFGGGNGLTFDNFVVAVPEPSSIAVMSLIGAAGLFVRRWVFL